MTETVDYKPEWVKNPAIRGMSCPMCKRSTLFLGEGNYVTCGNLECKEPDTGKAMELAEVLARIDQLNNIRASDTFLNHGTIELMGHMSQELNKTKLKLAGATKSRTPKTPTNT